MTVAQAGRTVPLHLVALLVAVLLLPALVPVGGDFPLNDDWVYAKSVRTLADDHRLERHPFAAVNAVGQTLIGAVFCLPFGFGFPALRLSTLLLALAATWATAQAGRTVGLSRAWSMVCGLVVLCNPLFMNLSYTFMTDVPFVAFTVLSGWFFLRALRHGRWQDVLAGSGLAAYAFFIRQPGAVLPLAFVISMAATCHGERRPPRIADVVALVAPWVLSLLLYLHWRSGSPTAYVVPAPAAMALVHRATLLLRHAARFVLYLGLFLAPLVTAVVADRLGSRGRRSAFAVRPLSAAAFAATFLVLLFCAGGRMPLLNNVLRDLGVGPLTIEASGVRGRFWAPVSVGNWWWPVTLACGAFGAVLLLELWKGLVSTFSPPPLRTSAADAARHPSTPEFAFLATWTILAVAVSYNSWVPVYFDRYLLAALPPLAILLCSVARPGTKTLPIAVALCAVFYAFSVVCLQDYLAWNTARWAAIGKLRSVYAVADEHIDGGYEFQLMYNGEEAMRRQGSTDYLRQTAPDVLFDVRYKVAFNPVPGFETLERVPYFSWLGFETRDVLILRRRGV
jgi:hypothetical protein